ncbi:GNAT family N-acetyltransferase [Simiduia litorea]|uniref:GNAT family N-acetyltransferase n=1 Tax=Simiduia litorea TaxID=1435348 RepID=UPI0036F33671
MSEPHWTLQSFDQLSNQQLYTLLQARSRVFVVEQQCIYQDQDDIDLHALHLSCWRGQTLLAYLRILPAGTSFDEVSIGRVLTTDAGRGQGLGKALMQRAIAACQMQYPGHSIRIGAQDYLRRFYQDLGFIVDSDIYDEDGIAHVEMLYSAHL